MSQATKVEDADKKAVLSSRNKDGAGAAQGQTGAEGIAGTEENGLKQPPPSSSGPPVHDESQMDHPRGPLDEKLKFFLANLPPSVTALGESSSFLRSGETKFVYSMSLTYCWRLLYQKCVAILK